MTLSVKDVSLTLAVDDATRFLVDGVDVPRPALDDGAEVGFSASRTEAGDLHLDVIDVHPEKQVAGPPADGSPVDGGGVVQAVSATPLVEGSTVTVAVDDGPLNGQTVTVTVGAATQWRAGKEPCQPTDLAAGTEMGFSATAAGRRHVRPGHRGAAARRVSCGRPGGPPVGSPA